MAYCHVHRDNGEAALEWREMRNYRDAREWRIATAGGRHFALFGVGTFDGCAVFVGAPGVYRVHFVSKSGRVSDLFDNEYRIDANTEKVEMAIGEYLVNVPAGIIGIQSFGLGKDGATVSATGADGSRVTSSECIPASEDHYQYTLVGHVDSSGNFHSISPESTAPSQTPRRNAHDNREFPAALL